MFIKHFLFMKHKTLQVIFKKEKKYFIIIINI
jgi:hypothetical protein